MPLSFPFRWGGDLRAGWRPSTDEQLPALMIARNVSHRGSLRKRGTMLLGFPQMSGFGGLAVAEKRTPSRSSRPQKGAKLSKLGQPRLETLVLIVSLPTSRQAALKVLCWLSTLWVVILDSCRCLVLKLLRSIQNLGFLAARLQGQD